MHTTNAPLHHYGPDQQSPAQSVAFDSPASLQQDFLLYIPRKHEADLATTLAIHNNWVQLTLVGQGTIYARAWGDGLSS